MDKKGYLSKLRFFLADTEGKMWDDTELFTLLDDALRKYCFDSGSFVGQFDFFPDKDGVYHYPDDFCSFMIGWNDDGREILQGTGRELFVRSYRDASRQGKVEYVFDDLDSYGAFSLFPLPADGQNAKTVSIAPDYGEIIGSEYGVYATSDYGLTLSVTAFDHAGTFFYHRMGTFEEVKDYMAVICYALFLAYNADSDFANPDIAAYWKRMYKSRLGATGRVVYHNAGRNVAGNFF